MNLSKVLSCFFAISVLLYLNCQKSHQVEDAKAIDGNDRVFMILANDWRMRAEEDPKLVLGVWRDGYIVWSLDKINGGSPYRKGRIRKDEIDALIRTVEKSGYAEIPQLKIDHLGPDSRFTTIALRQSDGSEFKMSSWHETREQGGNLVATDDGISSVGTSNRLEILKNEPSNYLFFRMAWAELKNSLVSVIPSESQAVEGCIVTDSTQKRSWRETQPDQKEAEFID